MKINCRFNKTSILLATLGVFAWTVAGAWEQVYCARVNSTSKTVWDPPFWYIKEGDTDYSTSTAKCAAVTLSRLGSYYHTANSMSPGQGFGLVCSNCTAVGDGQSVIYKVEVTQPTSNLATDTIFGVCSTNCAIGGLSGGAGYATNTTAFQPSYSADKWGFVCWLTNNPGVSQPELEFHYVSGGVTSQRHHADCVRFTLISSSLNVSAVRITSIAGGTIQYLGGSATRFILLKSASPGADLTTWQRADTNNITPGFFTIPAVGTDAAAFYVIESE
jgi:hypothetical protein